jgi:ABC-type uncharacterized transport system substrate-binding protein
VAVLYNPDHPFHVKAVEELKAIAPSLSIRLSVAAARIPEQFASAFSEIALTKADDKRAELLLQLKHFARREFQ